MEDTQEVHIDSTGHLITKPVITDYTKLTNKPSFYSFHLLYDSSGNAIAQVVPDSIPVGSVPQRAPEEEDEYDVGVVISTTTISFFYEVSPARGRVGTPIKLICHTTEDTGTIKFNGVVKSGTVSNGQYIYTAKIVEGRNEFELA